MGMNILKALRRIGIPVLALGAFFASCTEELSSEVVPGGGGGKTGEAEVTLKLQVPGAAAGKTRAGSIDTKTENAVNDLHILAFKVDDNGNETFEYYVKAKNKSETDDKGVSTWTASLKVREYEQTFVMIANALGTRNDLVTKITDLVKEGESNKVGVEKMEVLKTLTETLNQTEIEEGFDAVTHPFTMYGQTEAKLIELDGTPTLEVALHRIMARVNVTFSDNAADGTSFVPKEVYLYNFHGEARVIPDFLEQTTEDHVGFATIPNDGDAPTYPVTLVAGQAVPTYDVGESHEVKNTIYLFEVKQTDKEGNDKVHEKRPCLVVKGQYKGKTNYYRVDFHTQDKGYLDILRNHSYNITVTNVSGSGNSSAHEAVKNRSANITAKVIEWNDNTVGNIEFEGDRVLGIATKEYELMKPGGTRLQQVRATENVTWTATLYDVNPDGSVNENSQPDWIDFTDEDGKVQGGGSSCKSLEPRQGTNALQDVYFTVKGENPRPERKAIMRFTDDTGRLSVDALVVQNQKHTPVTLNVTAETLGATGIEFAETGQKVLTSIEFGPEDVTLSWQIVNGEKDGMEFNSVKMDNVEIATNDMKGEIPYASNNPTHYLEVNANTLQSPEKWETRNAKLQLIALHKSTGEMVVREIPLFQKKYGLEIDNAEFVCGGQEVRIYVRGNMPWNGDWSGQGFKDAVGAGLIDSDADPGSGTPNETYWSERSCISLQTHVKPLESKDPYVMDLTFTHQTKDITLPSMQVSIRGGVIEVNGKFYEVYGPVERSYNTKNDPYTDGGTNIQGANIMTYAQANALYDVAPSAVWGICKETEIVNCYTITHSRGSKNYAPGARIEEVIDISSTKSPVINEYVKMERYGPIVPDPVLQTQTLLNFGHHNNEYDYPYVLLEGSIPGTLDIKQLGVMKNGQHGMTFYPYEKNVTWTLVELKEGASTNARLPVDVYGDRFRGIFSANLATKKVSIDLTITDATSELDLTPWKNKPYKTYYFKPVD